MINVTKTYLPDVESYKKYVDKIFESGWITNNGQFVRQLTDKLERYLGVKNLILVSNGTLALQVAYKLLGLKGEVLTTPFSFVATTSSIVWEGMQPVFVDIDSNTLNIDYKKIEEKITSKTSAIVPVHVFGNGCDVEEIEKIARKHNLKVIYDAAHAFGIKYKDKSILSYGDVSILSFHATKIFHTIEGGAIIVNDNQLYEEAKKIINFGITGPDEIDGLGINAKMNEFQAAMGLCVLDNIDEILDKRKNVYKKYVDAFKELSNIKLQIHNSKCNNNYSYFPVIFKSEEELLEVKKKLNNIDIYPRRYFYPSLDTLKYTQCGYMEKSNEIALKILCLPMFDSLNSKIQKNIISLVKEYVK